MLINQDRRSVLISDEETNQQIDYIDDNFYKRKSVFERLGGSSTNASNANKEATKGNKQYQLGSDQSGTKRPKYDSSMIQKESHDKSHSNNQQSQIQHKSAQHSKHQQG